MLGDLAKGSKLLILNFGGRVNRKGGFLEIQPSLLLWNQEGESLKLNKPGDIECDHSI